ncbi:uncharacterized protein VICG_01030 [Vittaforma corneae ATCC 50505]|uniref:Uncharacterized protein n=1 Tax=Vittaforma corneae (strain ATCC 50505) TaxID=993615 RepID=L2GM89_VITCO|nr:uncharacterized protein VICG_01030 [Vittaforma corneae ATCC 50505]ELA42013.1 hypothetical protein VICG_01030 [Vittaforma corneae ATCC 50505]
MVDEEDEKILLKRESAKYEERIKKSKIREGMFKKKSEGYNKIKAESVPIIKTFLGYVLELYPDEIHLISDILVQSVKRNDVDEKINVILTKKIKNLEEIKNILGSVDT